jgi:hypothetical protein
MNTTDMNNIRKILFAIFRNNPIEIDGRTGTLSSFDIVTGNIEILFADGTRELTNIEHSRIILKPDDIPLHMNIYRADQIKDFSRMMTAEEIAKGGY